MVMGAECRAAVLAVPSISGGLLPAITEAGMGLDLREAEIQRTPKYAISYPIDMRDCALRDFRVVAQKHGWLRSQSLIVAARLRFRRVPNTGPEWGNGRRAARPNSP